jgi:diketogulonate reductase-like aldo/keto reductase
MHHITHHATRFILPKMQTISKTQQFQVAQVIVSYMIQSHEISLLSSTATTIDVAEQRNIKRTMSSCSSSLTDSHKELY